MRRFLLILIILITMGGGFVFWIFADTSVPDFEVLETRKVIESSKIFDRTGEILLYDIHREIKRTVIPFAQMPRHLKNATIAIEDAQFYQHRGVSFNSILRAFLINLLSGETRQGGSTITQQLVKNTFLTSEKTILRKVRELVLALKVESRYSKDEILNLYLNEIPYGASSYGAEAASQSYFGKPAEKLTLAETAYLAALPKAPTRLSPYGNNRAQLEARKNLVLEPMKSLGFISEQEYETAQKEAVAFVNRGKEGLKAPHFVMYVREYLVEKYGEDVVEQGGLKITTSLNWDWQKKAEKLVKKFAEDNENKFNAKNAGLVALDPKTGEILVMVGSRDYFDSQNDGNFNVALANRQPGSAFKPFVYAAAFQKGYTPETALFDLPTEFNPACNPDGTPGPGIEEDKCYHPQNYDEKFRGPLSLREALAQSVNVPSVKVLYLASLEEALRFARKVGINTLTDPARYGLTLVLGGGEVKLLELTGAYGAFANDGDFNPPTPILKVEDLSGNVLEEYKSQSRQAMEPQIARLISSVLSDNQARTPAFGRDSFLYIPERAVAVKTGTTNNYRDAWVVGYTPNLAAGVWAGNNDNSPMEKKIAGFIVAPLWNAFLKEIFKDFPKEEFIPPSPLNPPKPVLKGEWRGGKIYKIDKISKKLATEFTPEELVEEKVIREVHTILYWLDKNNPPGRAPLDPKDDAQFRNWERSVRIWSESQGLNDEGENVVPKATDDLHLPELKPKVSMLSPTGDFFRNEERIKVVLAVESRFPIEQIDFFLGSNYLGSLRSLPFEFTFILRGLPGEESKLLVNSYDGPPNNNTSL